MQCLRSRQSTNELSIQAIDKTSEFNVKEIHLTETEARVSAQPKNDWWALQDHALARTQRIDSRVARTYVTGIYCNVRGSDGVRPQ